MLDMIAQFYPNPQKHCHATLVGFEFGDERAVATWTTAFYDGDESGETQENVSLHERLGEAQAQVAQAEAQAQTQKQEAVARLEAALAARDKTIEVLRQQLVQARKGAPPSSAEQPGVA